MSQKWYYSVDGVRKGPVESADLRKLVEAGTIKPSDLVWKDGMAEWVEARKLKGLFEGESQTGERPAAEMRDANATDGRLSNTRQRRAEDEDGDDHGPLRRLVQDEQEDRPRSQRNTGDDVPVAELDEEEDRPARRRRDEDEDDDRQDQEAEYPAVIPRTSRAPSSFLDYLLFRRLVVPVIIQVVFWITIGFCILSQVIGSIYGLAVGLKERASAGEILGGIILGLMFMVLGCVAIRIYCELIIVIFRINETLTDIKNDLRHRR